MSRVHYDTILIDPANPPQVEYWAKELRVEPSELKAAMLTVGRRLTNVRRHFGKTAEIVCLADRRKALKYAPSTWTAFPPLA
jgi:Protein of unknown function (DUF3606)